MEAGGVAGGGGLPPELEAIVRCVQDLAFYRTLDDAHERQVMVGLELYARVLRLRETRDAMAAALDANPGVGRET